MKRMRFAAGSIVTGSVVADTLLDYVSKLSGSLTSVPVDVPVLETDGSLAIHTLLIGPASLFDVEDVAILSEEAEADELARFPVPKLPVIGLVAQPESPSDAHDDAAEFNQAVAHIDDSLS